MSLFQYLSKILSTVMSNLKTLVGLAESIQAIQVEQFSQRVLLLKILAAVTPPVAVGFRITYNLEGVIYEGVAPKMRNDQKLTATLTPVDKDGNDAKIDGVPTWVPKDPTLVTMTPDASGLNCEIAGIGPIGLAEFVASGDADLGAGVLPIFGTGSVPIEAGKAVGFKLKLSDPVDQ